MLHSSEGIVLAIFSKHVRCMESNEADVVAILHVIQMYGLIFPVYASGGK